MDGITGILRPDGEFISCDYGNHCVVAVEIPYEEEELCVYFSSAVKATNSYENSIVYFCDNDMTKKQMSWIMTNIDILDKKQYKLWVEYINNKR